MADPSTYRPAPGEIPTSPGVYRFLDGQGRVIYVGKAKNLRQRLSNYFQDLAALHPRTQKMVPTACAVEWTVVSTEVESLALEYSWIKEFNPRFNVMYKDDKSYPYLAVTMSETYPRAQGEDVGVGGVGQDDGIALDDLSEGVGVIAQAGGLLEIEGGGSGLHLRLDLTQVGTGAPGHEGAEVLGQRPMVLRADAAHTGGRALVDVPQQAGTPRGLGAAEDAG